MAHLRKYVANDAANEAPMVALLGFERLFFKGKTVRAWGLLLVAAEDT
jgi:hypothetical protein